jgi:molecular chaperone HtpG
MEATQQIEPVQKIETKQYDADISQLMNLIVNAFYSKSEIFLRELLSNSSDALEKLRYESLIDNSVLDAERELKIKIWVEDKKLIVEDTGIGMTRDDLVNNLGTIAKSGTKKFLENVKKGDVDKKGDIEQIGQFGVGFYSSFLVADKVEVYTKHNSDNEYIWESSATESYTIRENPNPSLKRGTKIVLHIKEYDDEYLDLDNVKDIITRYTQYISFPIEMLEMKEVIDDNSDNELDVEEESAAEDATEDAKIEDVSDDDDEDEEDTKVKTKKVGEWNIINSQKPIWCRKTDDITKEEYNEFYKNLTDDSSDALAYKHFHAEGQLEFDCLLYIPERTPLDMFDQGKKKKNIKLYVKRIFIMDDCDDLIPEWLKFMKGVVDSHDIPLNVSRELLQQNHILRQVSKVIVKRSIELFNELAEDEDEEKYENFYDTYNKMLKLGVHEDNRNRSKLAKLLRFYSSNSPDKYISLDNYIENMKEGQDSIYFITGQSICSLTGSPFIENFKTNGYDVLYFIDPIDEYMIQSMKEYEKIKLVDVSKEGIEFNTDTDTVVDNKELVDYLKETLKNKVQNVRISKRLTDTPCVLITSEQGWSANMERIVKSQAMRNNEMDHFMTSKKILEVNIEHNILKTLKEKLVDDENKIECDNIVDMLFDTAQINCGFMLEEPSDYAVKINKMIETGFC